MVYFRSINSPNAPEDPPCPSDGDADLALPHLDPVSSTVAIPVSSLASSTCPFLPSLFPSSSSSSSSSSPLSSTYPFPLSPSLSSLGYPFPVVLSSSSLSPSAYPFPLLPLPSSSLPSPPSLPSLSSSLGYPYSFPLLPSPPLSSTACPFPAFADSVSVAVAMQVPVFAPPPSSLPLRSASSSVQMSVDTARLLREMRPANDSAPPTSQESGNHHHHHNSSSSSNNNNSIQPWLQTLRLQSVGACREDERLPPLLGWNSVSTSSSPFNNEPDERLLDHLSQHFKARELGLLARCLCAPLVSIRVGRIDQEGCVLHPTSSRGYLNLSILQCSRLHLSFVGDDGHSERISLSLGSEHPPVALEVLSPDVTGRSFVIKLPGGRHVFFWQSEKIKDYGNELLIKMKDLLLRRPTLAQLTGVNESRFNSFMNDVPTSPLISPTVSSDANTFAPSSSVLSPQLQSSNQAAPVHVASSQIVSLGKAQFGSEGSSNSGFKDGKLKGAIGVRSIIMSREKQRTHISDISTKPTIPPYISAGCKIKTPQGAVDLIAVSGNNTEQHSVVSHSIGLYASLRPSCTAGNGLAWNHDTINLPVISTCSAPHTILSTLGTGFLSNLTSLQPSTLAHLSVTGSTILAPCYCPCPLRSSSSSLQYTVTPPYLPSAYVASSMPNSSSSSLFSIRSTPTIISPNSISLDRVSLSPISLPVSSLVNLTAPLQSSSFTSFFSDPIVHTPVIGVQSGAQSFLVNTPPIPKFINSILPNTGGHSEGADMPALSLLRQKGLSFPWENKPEDVQSNADKPLSFLTDLPCLDLIKSGFRSRLSAAGGFAEQDPERSWDKKESCLSSFGEALTVPFNILYETMPIASNHNDTVHYGTSSQHEESFLGKLPTKINGRSLSCLLSFSEDKGKSPNIWISGSRGLYGGSCDPGMPVPAYHSSVMSLESKCTCGEKSSDNSDTCVESSLMNPVDDEIGSEQNANSQ